MVSRAALIETGLLQPGSLINYSYRLRLPEATDLAIWQEDLTAAFPDATWRVQTTNNAAPRLDWLLQRLTLFLTLVGLTVPMPLVTSQLSTSTSVRTVSEPSQPTAYRVMSLSVVIGSDGSQLAHPVGSMVT